MFPNFCNNCFCRRNLRTNPELQLNISSCGHILCAECLRPNCPKCARPYKATVIDQTMPHAMKLLFDDPQKQHEQYLKTVKFQLTQDAIFNNYMVNQMPSKFLKLQRQSEGLTRIEAQLEQSIANEKRRIAKLKTYLAYHERRQEQPRVVDPPMPRPMPGRRNSAGGYSNRASTMVSDCQRRFKPTTPTLSLDYSSGSGGGTRDSRRE